MKTTVTDLASLKQELLGVFKELKKKSKLSGDYKVWCNDAETAVASWQKDIKVATPKDILPVIKFFSAVVAFIFEVKRVKRRNLVIQAKLLDSMDNLLGCANDPTTLSVYRFRSKYYRALLLFQTMAEFAKIQSVLSELVEFNCGDLDQTTLEQYMCIMHALCTTMANLISRLENNQENLIESLIENMHDLCGKMLDIYQQFDGEKEEGTYENFVVWAVQILLESVRTVDNLKNPSKNQVYHQQVESLLQRLLNIVTIAPVKTPPVALSGTLFKMIDPFLKAGKYPGLREKFGKLMNALTDKTIEFTLLARKVSTVASPEKKLNENGDVLEEMKKKILALPNFGTQLTTKPVPLNQETASQKTVAKKKKKKKSAQQTEESLIADLKNKQEECKRQKNLISSQEERLKVQSNEIKNLEIELKKYKETVKILEGKYQTHKKYSEQSQSKNSLLKNRLAEIISEKDKIHREKIKLQEKFSHQEGKSEGVAKNLQTSEEKCVGLEEKLKQKNLENDRLNVELSQAQIEIGKLTAQLKEVDAELKATHNKEKELSRKHESLIEINNQSSQALVEYKAEKKPQPEQSTLVSPPLLKIMPLDTLVSAAVSAHVVREFGDLTIKNNILIKINNDLGAQLVDLASQQGRLINELEKLRAENQRLSQLAQKPTYSRPNFFSHS